MSFSICLDKGLISHYMIFFTHSVFSMNLLYACIDHHGSSKKDIYDSDIIS